MAITRRISKEEYDAHPGDSSYYTLPDRYSADFGATSVIYMHRTHAGLVLYTGEYNGYHDSDFYADVWDWEKGAPTRIEYATTRFPTEDNHADVDATDEVARAYHAYTERLEAERRAREAEREAKTPRRGKTVKVVRGRKVPLGTVGTVIWEGTDKFSGKPRLGVKDARGEVHWTSAANVEVVTDDTAPEPEAVFIAAPLTDASVPF